MAVGREQQYDIRDILGESNQFATDESIFGEDILDPTNSLLLGSTSRTSTTNGRTATVKAGEDIRPALESLKSAGGGTLVLLAGVHNLSHDLVIESNITVRGEGKYKTIIDFSSGAYGVKIKGEILTNAGTASLTEGANTVTGSGTSFTSATKGDWLRFGNSDQTNLWMEIDSVGSDTSLTLKENWPLDTVTGSSLVLLRTVQGAQLADCTVKDAGAADAVEIHYAQDVQVTNVLVEGASSDGIETILILDCEFLNVEANYCGADGFDCGDSATTSFLNCSAVGNGSDGFEYTGVGRGDSFINCRAAGNAANGFRFVGSSPSVLFCYATNNVGDGFDFITGDNGMIVSCRSNENNGNGFYIQTGVDGCTFTGCIADNNDVTDWNINSIQEGSNVFVGCNVQSPVSTSDNHYSIVGGSQDQIIGCGHTSTLLERHIRRMQNTSGGALAVGDVVIYKSAAAGDEITTTTTQGNDHVWGMVLTAVSDTQFTNILTEGYTTELKVNGTTAIAVGDFLGTYTSAGIAQKAAAGDMAFAIALEAYSTADSNGVIDALLVKPRKI